MVSSICLSNADAATDPTLNDVAYGEHERQVLDLYQAESLRPAPVVVYLHGGGWVNGNEASVPRLDEYLDAGISVARQSTRLTCVGIRNVQSSLDPAQMKAWTPNSRYGGDAFGFTAMLSSTKRATMSLAGLQAKA